MKHVHRTDFWFAGVAILPVVLIVAGYLEVVVMFFMPLLIVACLHGLYEQKLGQSEEMLRDAGMDDAGTAVPPSAALPGQNSQLTLSD